MIKRIIILIGVFLLLLYFVPLALVISNQNSTIKGNIDYLIVLGAKVNGKYPSAALQYRLDEAITLYNENPKLHIIVTGGQGIDEEFTEASVMKEYLIKNGVAQNKIIIEDKSTTTFENIYNTKMIIGSGDVKVGVVTNAFHIYRVKMICKRVFNFECQMQASRNPKSIQGLFSILREPLALYKSFFLDK